MYFLIFMFWEVPLYFWGFRYIKKMFSLKYFHFRHEKKGNFQSISLLNP